MNGSAMRPRRWALRRVVILLGLLASPACDVVVDGEELPATGDGGDAADAGGGVTWSATVDPVLSEYCERCHNASTQSGGVDLSSHAAVMETGVVVPGDADGSRLVLVISSGVMPPAGQPAPPAEAVGWIRQWIDAGAQYD